MEKIDEKTVRHVALLSRLILGRDDISLYSRQLATILTYIDKLNEVDTARTEPTSHVLPTLKNVDRPDAGNKSLEVEDVLKNAPDRSGDFFKIPKVIEGK